MSRQLTGNIKDGLNAGENGLLKFLATSSNSSSGLVKGSVAIEPVVSGAYDVTVIDGNYTVYWIDTDLRKETVLGDIAVTTGAATNIFALLSAGANANNTFYLNDLTDVSTTGANTNGKTYGLTYSSLTGGYAMDSIAGGGDMLSSTYDPANKNEQVLTVSDVLDEDDFASDSATLPPSQQSVKKYVDANAGGFTQEEIEDFVGAMFSTNTETLITVTYQDSDGTIDLVVNGDLSNYNNSTSGFITANSAEMLTNKSGAISQWTNDAGYITFAPVQSVNGATGTVVLDADDIADTSTINKFTSASEISKLAGIESGADVTDATNVAAAGAVMDGDFSGNGIMRRTGAGVYDTVSAPTGAIVGTSDSQTLTNKTIDAASNSVSNIATSTFASGVIDTDGTLSANSNTKIPTQAAVKAYADQLIAAADVMVFKGVIDCSSNPNYPAADAGWSYRVSVAGKIGGASGVNVEVGDILLCLVDSISSGNHATVGTNWSIAQTNIDGAVTGPASSTSGNLPTFNGSGGKVIQDSGYSIASLLSRANHTGTQLASTISDFSTAVGSILTAAIGSTVQAYHAILASLSGLTITSGKVPYGSGSNTFSTADSTSYGRGLWNVADEAALKALINAEAGTDFQAYSANLAAFAGLTSAADKMPYFTGSGTAATATLTSTARNLLDDTSEGAMRTTLSAATTTQTDACFAGFIASPSDKTYKLVVKAPHGGTITECTTISVSGTCTATFKINTTALGGTANSVSSSEQSQSHSSSNSFSAGDDIQLTVSSNSSCADMSFTIKYTRTLA